MSKSSKSKHKTVEVSESSSSSTTSEDDGFSDPELAAAARKFRRFFRLTANRDHQDLIPLKEDVAIGVTASSTS